MQNYTMFKYGLTRCFLLRSRTRLIKGCKKDTKRGLIWIKRHGFLHIITWDLWDGCWVTGPQMNILSPYSLWIGELFPSLSLFMLDCVLFDVRWLFDSWVEVLQFVKDLSDFELHDPVMQWHLIVLLIPFMHAFLGQLIDSSFVAARFSSWHCR